LHRKFLKNLTADEHQRLLTLMKKACPDDDHRYWVCNQDESYAGQVINTIMEGESAKERLPGFRRTMPETTFNVYLYRNVFFRVDGVRAVSFEEALAKAFETVDKLGGGFDSYLQPGGSIGNVQEAEQGLGALIDQLNVEGDVESCLWIPDWVVSDGQTEEGE